ncbi:hypothetical protein D3C80_2225040 [compost metagenome]
MKAESIGEPAVIRLYRCLPVIKEPVGAYFAHFIFVMIGFPVIFIACQRINAFHILLFGPDA